MPQKKRWITGVCLMLGALCLLLPALAAQGGSLEAFGQVIPLDARQLDLGAYQAADLDALMRVLDQLPNLEQVDMYETDLSPLTWTGWPPATRGFFGWTIHIHEHTIRTDATAFHPAQQPLAPAQQPGL